MERDSDDARSASADQQAPGYHSVTPHLPLADAARALRFYRKALGAVELYRLRTRDGKIAHAELQIGDSRITLSDEAPEWGSKSARTCGGSPIVLRIYTREVDALAARFVSAGGTIVNPLRNQFFGDRSGQFLDPEGYCWILAQRIENLAPEEMARRTHNLVAEAPPQAEMPVTPSCRLGAGGPTRE